MHTSTRAKWSGYLAICSCALDSSTKRMYFCAVFFEDEEEGVSLIKNRSKNSFWLCRTRTSYRKFNKMTTSQNQATAPTPDPFERFLVNLEGAGRKRELLRVGLHDAQARISWRRAKTFASKTKWRRKTSLV